MPTMTQCRHIPYTSRKNKPNRKQILIRRRRSLKYRQTIPEQVTKQCLEELNILHRVQYLVYWKRSGDGYILDFYLPEYKLAIEIDGDSHRTEKAISYDKKRTEMLKNVGIDVVRIDNEYMHNHLIGIHLIMQAIKDRPMIKIDNSLVPHRLIIDAPGTMRWKDVVSYIGVSHDRLRAMVRSQEIPRVRSGKKHVFLKRVVDRWLETNTVRKPENDRRGI